MNFQHAIYEVTDVVTEVYNPHFVTVAAMQRLGDALINGVSMTGTSGLQLLQVSLHGATVTVSRIHRGCRYSLKATPDQWRAIERQLDEEGRRQRLAA